MKPCKCAHFGWFVGRHASPPEEFAESGTAPSREGRRGRRGAVLTANIVVAIGLLSVATIAAVGLESLEIAKPVSTTSHRLIEPIYSIALTHQDRIVHALSRRDGVVTRLVSTGEVLGRLETSPAAIMEISSAAHGRSMAVGHIDGRLELLTWANTEDREPAVKPLDGHPDEITTLRFSPDDRRIISASRDGLIRVWQADTGMMMRQWQAPIDRPYDLRTVVLSSDGTQALAVNCCRMHLWDLSTGEEVRVFDGRHHPMTCASLMPSGDQIISSSWGRQLQAWDVHDGRILWTTQLTTETECILQIVPLDDGARFVTGDLEGRIRIWNTATGEMLGEQQHHSAHISELHLSIDRQTLYSSSYDGTIRLWEIGRLLDKNCRCTILQ